MRHLFEYIDNNQHKFLSFWEDICNMEGVAEDKPAMDAITDKIQSFALISAAIFLLWIPVTPQKKVFAFLPIPIPCTKRVRSVIRR